MKRVGVETMHDRHSLQATGSGNKGEPAIQQRALPPGFWIVGHGYAGLFLQGFVGGLHGLEVVLGIGNLQPP